MIFGFKTKYEKQLEQSIEDLEAKIEKLEEEIYFKETPEVQHYIASSNPTGVAAKYADEIRDELFREISPILKKEVLYSISNMDWNDVRQTPMRPKLDVSYCHETQVHRFHMRLPELNYVFNVVSG